MTKSQIIINADDFGISRGVNKAIFELVDSGIVTSTSVMSNMPYYEDTTRLEGKIGIGVHFNLTTGQPVTGENKVPGLVDNLGNFLSLSNLLKKYRTGRLSKSDIELEFTAQLQCLIDMGISPDHIDAHESLLKYPIFESIARKVAKKFKVLAVRTYHPRKLNVGQLLYPKKFLIFLYLRQQKMRWKTAGFRVADRYDSLIQFGLDGKTALEKLNHTFTNLPNGILEMAVHPGYCNGDHALLGKYVYEREVELRVLLSNQFKRIFENSRGQLISFKDITAG